VGFRKKSRFVVLPAPHAGDPGALPADVDGNGTASVDPGAAVFPQPCDFVQGVEPRGRRDFRARCGAEPEKLDWLSRELIGRCVLQGYSQEEAAPLIGCCRRTVERRLPEALDKLSEILQAVGILKPIGDPVNADGEPCQEAKTRKTP